MQLSLKSSRSLLTLSQRWRLHYLLVVFGALYAVWMLFTFPHWTVDDAYISFRYAYNLVHHGELNWNVGYDPVEGYTGIMLPLLIAPILALNGDPVVASQAIGLLSFGACAILLWLILGRMGTPPVVRSVVQALLLTTPSLYVHVFAGLETLLFAALILASFYALLRRSDAALSALLLLTSLVRPEGALLAICFIGVRAIQLWRGHENMLGFLVRVAALFVIPGGLYFAWRWNYYGYPLPNTFYVKANSGQFGLSAVYWFATYLLLPSFALILTSPTLARVKGYAIEIAALLVFAVILCVVYSRSVLLMNYGHRFYMPLYPIGLVILGALAGLERRKVRFLALAIIPLAAQLVWCFTLVMDIERNWVTDYQDTLIHEHLATANFIKSHVPADEWVVLNDTGIMPYVSQRKTIDSGALNDEFLAHAHDPNAARAYLNSFHAAAIAIPWFPGSDEQGLDPYSLLPDPSGYQLITNYKDPQWLASYKGFREYLFLRKDLIK